MKTLNKIVVGSLAAMLVFTACDPNEELYEQLDNLQEPYNKKIEYTVTSSDYNAVGGKVGTYQAFNDTAQAMFYVPSFLASKFVALNLKSAAMVNYNYLVLDTTRAWEKVVFGYTLTTADYDAIGGSIAVYQEFWSSNPAVNHLPGYLPTLFPSATEGQEETIIYNFYTQAFGRVPYADIYVFDGTVWNLVETITDIAEADHILAEDDYISMGFSSPRFPNVSTAESYLPIWLKQNFPYDFEGTKYIIQYAYGSATSTNNTIEYEYDGEEWVKNIGYEIEQRSEQYVYATDGWIFDPTIRFIMERTDYETIALNDPIPHPRFVDQGYYFGASAYYRNFDMRLLSFHLRVYTWEDKVYDPEIDDPELVNIYNTEGAEAATNELFRRITQEGIIILLENKFPDAQPQVNGVDAHFVVGFETYNDNLSRSYLEAEYRCVEAASGGNPPVFEFIEGPRERQ